MDVEGSLRGVINDMGIQSYIEMAIVNEHSLDYVDDEVVVSVAAYDVGN